MHFQTLTAVKTALALLVGLKYQDLLIEYPDVQEALRRAERADPQLILARNRRLARASDVLLKMKPLPEHIQEKQDPYDLYLNPYLEAVRRKRAEREDKEMR
jgi:Ubiquinol-cytochrome C reductase complex 14kD subunit